MNGHRSWIINVLWGRIHPASDPGWRGGMGGGEGGCNAPNRYTLQKPELTTLNLVNHEKVFLSRLTCHASQTPHRDRHDNLSHN